MHSCLAGAQPVAPQPTSVISIFYICFVSFFLLLFKFTLLELYGILTWLSVRQYLVSFLHHLFLLLLGEKFRRKLSFAITGDFMS